MGISIAIYETDSDEALCKTAKTSFKKVYLRDVKGFEDFAEADTMLPAPEAKQLLGAEWDGFLKRNRIDADAEVIYLDKVKSDADHELLAPKMRRCFTGWVFLDKVSADQKQRIIGASSPDDRLTGWDMLSFEEMGETCKKCGLSWDKGRGCIGDFGPESSLLPQIAKKLDLPIIAGVVESAKAKRAFSPDDAPELLREVQVLRQKMPAEPKGKLLMSRYGGVLERLEGVANTALKYKTRFYFV
jgi:hypothetical protein